MFFGKIIGCLIGYAAAGYFGAIAGLIIGHLFDRGYSQVSKRASPEHLQKVQDCFFQTTFTLLGHLAKADGRISEQEIAQTESLMLQMGLNAEHRKSAITYFKQGAEPSFNLDATVNEFRQLCGAHPNLVQMLLVYLVNVALADGHFDETEESIVAQVAGGLGIPRFAFERLIQMIKAQNSFQGGHFHGDAYGTGAAQSNSLDLAYQALGVSRDASDGEIKRAYRRLMSQYHPDKLSGQGMPQDMIKAATERSQEIQTAYDTIKKARGS
jgi:DnaJ like chaperone protein